jgi:hypothetical protein
MGTRARCPQVRTPQSACTKFRAAILIRSGIQAADEPGAFLGAEGFDPVGSSPAVTALRDGHALPGRVHLLARDPSADAVGELGRLWGIVTGESLGVGDERGHPGSWYASFLSAYLTAPGRRTSFSKAQIASSASRPLRQ